MKKIFVLFLVTLTITSCIDGFIKNMDGSKKNNARLIADADKFCELSSEYSEIMNKLNDVEKVCNIANEYSGMLKPL